MATLPLSIINDKHFLFPRTSISCSLEVFLKGPWHEQAQPGFPLDFWSTWIDERASHNEFSCSAALEKSKGREIRQAAIWNIHVPCQFALHSTTWKGWGKQLQVSLFVVALQCMVQLGIESSLFLSHLVCNCSKNSLKSDAIGNTQALR